MREPLSSELGFKIPDNHVKHPPLTKIAWGQRDFTIRRICCGTCDQLICALVDEDEYNGDFIFPNAIVCEKGEHRLVPRKDGDFANVTCYGKSVMKHEAEKFLEGFLPAH